MGQLVEAHWNGRWGRQARRDIRLEHEPEQWTVTARQGGPDGTEHTWTFDNEADAHAMVAQCIATGGAGWKEITNAYRVQQDMRDHRAKPNRSTSTEQGGLATP